MLESIMKSRLWTSASGDQTWEERVFAQMIWQWFDRECFMCSLNNSNDNFQEKFNFQFRLKIIISERRIISSQVRVAIALWNWTRTVKDHLAIDGISSQAEKQKVECSSETLPTLFPHRLGETENIYRIQTSRKISRVSPQDKSGNRQCRSLNNLPC